MAGKVTDRDMGFADLQRTLRRLAGTEVRLLVGVHGETHSSMVVIAATNEYGSADGHVPERSYLRSTVDEGLGDVLDDLQGAVDAALGGANLDMVLGRVGEKWVTKVKAKIKAIRLPANAASTIARKGADNPLIHHGRLRNSITWTLSKGKAQAAA